MRLVQISSMREVHLFSNSRSYAPPMLDIPEPHVRHQYHRRKYRALRTSCRRWATRTQRAVPLNSTRVLLSSLRTPRSYSASIPVYSIRDDAAIRHFKRLACRRMLCLLLRYSACTATLTPGRDHIGWHSQLLVLVVMNQSVSTPTPFEPI